MIVFFFSPFRIVSHGILKHCKNKYPSLTRKVNSKIIPSFSYFSKERHPRFFSNENCLEFWFGEDGLKPRVTFGVYGVLSLILNITFASLMFFFRIHLYESRKKPTAIEKIQLTELIFMIILNSLSYCFSTVLHASVWMIKRETRKLLIEQFDTEFKSTIELYRNKTR